MPMPEYIRQIRTKIGHDLLFMPAITAVVVNDAGQVLLQRRSDSGEWGLLSGIMDPGEEPADAVIREVYEEAGIDVLPERITGVYTGQEYFRHYSNGDEVIYLDITFLCRPLSGQPHVNDEESLEIRYCALDKLPAMSPANHERLEHALRNEQAAFFRRTSEK